MRLMRLAIGSLLLSMLSMGAAPAFALSLDEAKAKGLIGEKTDGYLGLVVPGNAEAQALANDINHKRRQAYQDIARRGGAHQRAVETLAGEKAIEKTKPGHFVEGPGGWVKK
jgi:uncharacterized protein YdbL (DUF1318 family)